MMMEGTTLQKTISSDCRKRNFTAFHCTSSYHLPVVLFLLLVVYSSLVQGQLQYRACDPTEGFGTLRVAISEATDAEILADPTNPAYNVKLGLFGTLGSSGREGVVIVLKKDDRTPNEIGDPNNYFRLYDDGNTIMVKLVKGINRDGERPDQLDDVNVIEFTLECQSKTSAAKHIYPVVIQIQDVNDNTPIFLGTPFLTSVNELTPIGTTIYKQIIATDLDSGRNGDVQYRIIPGDGSMFDGSRKFRITLPSQGLITVSSQLDFESLNAENRNYYILNISASDESPLQPKKKKVPTATLR